MREETVCRGDEFDRPHAEMAEPTITEEGHEEWMLYPEVVKQIWRVFGQAQGDLFVPQEISQCPLWFSLTHPAPPGLDAMVQTWTRLCLYAFPPIALLLGVLARVRWDRVHLLLVAPFWPGRVWFSDLISLLDGSPWEISSHRLGHYHQPSAGAVEAVGVVAEGAQFIASDLLTEAVETILGSFSLHGAETASLTQSTARLVQFWSSCRPVSPQS